MSKILPGQVIAATGFDDHGESFSREQLQELFLRTPEPILFKNEHDSSKPPIARGFNKRLEELSTGHLAIKADIEVLDEGAFGTGGGYSIEFPRYTWQFGQGQNVIQLLLNPQQFDFTEVPQALANLVPADLRKKMTLKITERVEKGVWLEAIVIVVVLEATRAIWSGFFSRIGEAVFDYLRSWRQKNRQHEGTLPIQLQLQLNVVIGERPVQIVLKAEPHVSANELARLDCQAVCSVVKSALENRLVHKVLGVVHSGPRVEFEFVVSPDGTSEPFRHRWENTSHL